MDPSQAIADFCGVTGADDAKAREFLEASHYDVQQAAANYFAATEQDSVDTDVDDDEPQPAQSSSSAAPIGGAQQSSSASKGKGKKVPRPNTKFSSLGDLQRREEAGEQDDDSDKDQEYFAGGEKSGMAVKDPKNGGRSADDHIQRLLKTAKQNRERPESPENDGPSRPSAFTGSGQTLGGDDTPSRTIPSANPAATTAPGGRPTEMVERSLHLWTDGFSVDDGPLYRYDDPANAHTLDMINRGSAPLDIMNVAQGQAVDVKLETHRGENYVRPKKKWKAFEGGGQRLGSPTPGDPASAASASGSTSTVPITNSSATPAVNTNAATNTPAQPSTDSAQPTLTLQIRLADGTRLPTRFNTSATIGDLYDFVDRAGTATARRAYSLATTFPTKELNDRGAVLGELAEFKRGGVVVQKWS